MHAKLFAPLLPTRIKPASKFPQLHLCANKHRILTNHRQFRVPFDAFHENSVSFALREVQPGQIVELRREDQRLIALGFFEPELHRVDVFELTPAVHTSLPIISEDFFMSRLHDAWESRHRILHQTRTNTYRIANGYADGLPSLYVDIFSQSFVRIIATSSGAERLVPATAEFLRRRGSEEIVVDTPQLSGMQRVTLSSPTLPLSRVYVEGGVRYLWLPTSPPLPSSAAGASIPPNSLHTIENTLLLQSAHRRARFMLRDLSRSKRVLCVNDRSGGAAMNAVMTARQVTVVEPEPVNYSNSNNENNKSNKSESSRSSITDWIRSNMVDNHSANILENVQLWTLPLHQLSLYPQQDVVYLEHHPWLLATKAQWKLALLQLIQKKIIGAGTIVIAAQESAPLGIADLQARWKLLTGTHDCMPASRVELACAFRESAEQCQLRARFLRTFSASCDYPLLPEENALAFAQIFLIDNPFTTFGTKRTDDVDSTKE